MNTNIHSFKKACEAKEASKANNTILCYTNSEHLGAALRVLNSMFGYLSIIEHYQASHSRHGIDIFEGADKLILGGLMQEDRELVICKLKDGKSPDLKMMGAHEFTVLDIEPDNAGSCQFHSFLYTEKPPYVIVREETKSVFPSVYSSILGGVERLKAVRPMWECIADTPGINILRPSQ
jgi:dipeptidyl aminopeptidase/acylaminoacyl peptidase